MDGGSIYLFFKQTLLSVLVKQKIFGLLRNEMYFNIAYFVTKDEGVGKSTASKSIAKQ